MNVLTGNQCGCLGNYKALRRRVGSPKGGHTLPERADFQPARPRKAFSMGAGFQPQSMGAEESARRRSVGLPLPGERMRSGDVERKTRACKGEPRTGSDSLVNLMQVIV